MNGHFACLFFFFFMGNIWSTLLKLGRKFGYMGNRRFLPIDHSWRKYKRSFDQGNARNGSVAYLICQLAMTLYMTQLGELNVSLSYGEMIKDWTGGPDDELWIFCVTILMRST